MREEILTIIEKNNKLSTKDLADMFGVDESIIINEIAKMEEEKVICGYHTLINWDKTEKESVTALIEVKVTPQRGRGFDQIAERIYNFPEVKSVYLMSGSFDLTVVIEGRTMKEVAMFVSEKLAPLEPVLSTATHFILKKYKDHGTVMEVVTKPERMAIVL
ncbi:MAG: Lrp/AsnC family transcriptional regulator [Firmicutes bacterium]|uniref:Lrp/AsnC family transcriptional regulator n=1 Tax=Candidatus Scybalomonas excrementavium TaxID=2840943 RepID=A0A9D9I1L9_9FIRM|nr:Lrp/AsnC family transcriptional regulator [Candidatus Scybalomonas excrementavium]